VLNNVDVADTVYILHSIIDARAIWRNVRLHTFICASCHLELSTTATKLQSNEILVSK